MKQSLFNLFKEKGIEFLQSDRLSLDSYYYEPFQDNKQTFDERKIFETSDVKFVKTIKPYHDSSIFSFFLDGSRKPYKIGDMITTDNKFAQVVAGQIGAACCQRPDKKIHLHKLKRKNLLMVFDSVNQEDFIDLKTNILQTIRMPVDLEKYSFDKVRDDAPTNAAVAQIQKKNARYGN